MDLCIYRFGSDHGPMYIGLGLIMDLCIIGLGLIMDLCIYMFGSDHGPMYIYKS